MGIKFHSANDLSSGGYIADAEHMQASNYVFGDSVNDILEKYNIHLYVGTGISWSHDPTSLRQWASSFLSDVQKWFNSAITDDTFCEIFSSVHPHYMDNFWELFERQKRYLSISSNVIKICLRQNVHILQYILQQKKTCAAYDSIIADHITETQPVDLLIQVYDRPAEYTLPKSLTSNSIEKIFADYIVSEHPHPNILHRVSIWKSRPSFLLSDKIQFQAKMKHNQYCQNFVDQGQGFGLDASVSFVSDQEDLIKFTRTGCSYDICYSSLWIQENLDYPTLFNNFIYMLEFVDVLQMRIKNVSLRNQASTLEMALTNHSPYSYPDYSMFKTLQAITSMGMTGYYKILKDNGISLEDMIVWFFETYLPTEFGADIISVQMPSSDLAYREKCTLLCHVFDSVAKQYKSYVEDGTIDAEFIAFSRTPIALAEVPSQHLNKYVYGTGNWFHHACFCLFSNQSMLNYVPRFRSKYTSMYELIQNETVSYQEYNSISIRELEWLEKQKLITIDSDGTLSITDRKMAFILHDLYQNEVISFHHYGKDFAETFDRLYALGATNNSSMLLSKKEIDYFSYYLDDKYFDNGLRIRNSYAHGGSQLLADENIHAENYFTLLRLLVLLILKINDDFCIKPICSNGNNPH